LITFNTLKKSYEKGYPGCFALSGCIYLYIILLKRLTGALNHQYHSFELIVKEKSISGNFDSVVLNIRLFSHSDTIFADSIYDNIGHTSVLINTSRFAQNRFVYFGKDEDLSEYDGDTVAYLCFWMMTTEYAASMTIMP
jgi:hypothetical protein